ncbi:MAG: hypothetical protein V4487_07825, partial [Chlamydiota bacterium]
KILKKIFRVIKQCLQLVKELLYTRPSKEMFDRNIERLEVDFEKMRERVDQSNKPICAYFVAPYDESGAILGDNVYYYYHYKIKNFEKHYGVAPFVSYSAQEMFSTLKDLKKKYPDREIQIVDFTSHGWPKGLYVPNKSSSNQIEEEVPTYDVNAITPDQFRDCAKNATIILDACSTGKGVGSIGEELAKQNPGKTFFAPKRTLFFSKPILSEKNGKPTIAHVVHGLAIFNAFTAGRFEELLPARKEILRSGKGRQVPCREWTESSLDPVLKNRDCAELPVQY